MVGKVTSCCVTMTSHPNTRGKVRHAQLQESAGSIPASSLNALEVNLCSNGQGQPSYKYYEQSASTATTFSHVINLLEKA